MKKPIVYTLFPVPLIENELDIPKKIKESLIKQKYERVTINNGHISVDEYILNKPKYKSLLYPSNEFKWGYDRLLSFKCCGLT